MLPEERAGSSVGQLRGNDGLRGRRRGQLHLERDAATLGCKGGGGQGGATVGREVGVHGREGGTVHAGQVVGARSHRCELPPR